MTPTRVLVALNGTVGGANLSAAQLVRALPAPYEGCIVHPSGLEPTREILDATPRVGVAYLPGWHLAHDAPRLARWRWYVMRNARSGLHLRSVGELRALCARWGVGLMHTNTSQTLSPALAARALGLPHVWHVRELIGRGAAQRFPLGDAATARIFAALSDRIVANSEATAAFFRAHLGDDAVTVIPNGVAPPTSDAAEAGRALRSRLGIAQDAPVVGMIASLSSAVKGHGLVIEAFAHVRTPGARLVLFGDIPDSEPARAIQASAARDPRVILAGHAPDPWVALAAADVLAHGGAESFGRVFVEAMLAGRPVVAPRVGGAAEIVVEGLTGFLTAPGDARELAARLEALLGDEGLRRRLGAAGAVRARERYTLEAHVGAMVRVYDEVLCRDSAGRTG